MRHLSKVLLAISLVFSLTACGYGSVAETAQMGPVGNGADVVLGDLKIQEVLVINDGVNAVVTAVIINTGEETDTLLGIGAGKELVSLVDTTSGTPTRIDELAIPARSSVSLSFTQPYGATLVDSGAGLPALGSIAKINFVFANSGIKSVKALTFANEDYYSTINPSAFVVSN